MDGLSNPLHVYVCLGYEWWRFTLGNLCPVTFAISILPRPLLFSDK